MNKKRVVATLIILPLFLLCSCGRVKYRSDVSCDELTDIIESSNEKEYQRYDRDYENLVTKTDESNNKGENTG